MAGELNNCEGGIIALDGSSGDTLWQRWTAFNVFSIYCSQDLNNDSINDCIASGRGGVKIKIINIIIIVLLLIIYFIFKCIEKFMYILNSL